MSDSQINAELIWTTWKENFPSFVKQYYGEQIWRNETFGDREMTVGVITPFVLTSLAPKLRCRVRFEQDRMDAILYDGEGVNRLAHFEFENNYGSILGEIPKLKRSKPQLKCVVSNVYEKDSEEDDLEVFQTFFSDLIEPAISKSITENPKQTWLVIVAVGTFWDVWKGYKIWHDGSEVKTLQLT